MTENHKRNRNRTRERIRAALVQAIEQTPVPAYDSVVNPHEYWATEVTTSALVLLGLPEKRAQGLATGCMGVPPSKRLDRILRALR